MEFMTNDRSGKGLPPSLAGPNINQDQMGANVEPIKYLPASLIPYRIYRQLLPPCLHWGFKLTLERLQEILLKNGYPMDTESSETKTMQEKFGIKEEESKSWVDKNKWDWQATRDETWENIWPFDEFILCGFTFFTSTQIQVANLFKSDFEHRL
ncbi:hypothetical protein C8J56DRAFT_1054412 [Mycena floridula]|nr:hypothetical protein C8J56DRAFT_1054412 [Mycena floridula]